MSFTEIPTHEWFKILAKYPVFSEKRKQLLFKTLIKLPTRTYFLLHAFQNVTKDASSFLFHFSEKKNIYVLILRCSRNNIYTSERIKNMHSNKFFKKQNRDNTKHVENF